MVGLAARDILLSLKVPYFHISLSHGSINAIHAARLRRKCTISFTDNEKSALGNRISFRFIDYLITPKALSRECLTKYGIREERIIQYDGYKEDIYEADYEPSPNFLDRLPFDEFITIRPEALQAAYVRDKNSIVPDLLQAFDREGLNVLYLPRYPGDRSYAKWNKGLHAGGATEGA